MAKLSKLFTGKDTKSEEMKEARAVKAGKVTPAQYARGEKAEEKKEGEKAPAKAVLVKRAQAMKSGKLTPAQYAKNEAKKK